MKTESEQVPRWDDIIFKNRNQEYGAYAIRKNYNSNVLKAEAISIGIGVLIFIIPILFHDEEILLPVIDEREPPIVLENYRLEPKITPPAPRQTQRANASIIPTRVTTREVPDEPSTPETDEVSYTTGPDTGTTDSGVEVSTGSGSGTIPVDVPTSLPYVLAPEVMPAYEGGMEAMMKFLQKKTRYPASAVRRKEQGVVFVSFIISQAGTVTQVEVIKGVSKDCDQEAVRVISSMNKWKPGLQNKMPVAVKMVLPIKFKLDS